MRYFVGSMGYLLVFVLNFVTFSWLILRKSSLEKLIGLPRVGTVLIILLGATTMVISISVVVSGLLVLPKECLNNLVHPHYHVIGSLGFGSALVISGLFVFYKQHDPGTGVHQPPVGR